MRGEIDSHVRSRDTTLLGIESHVHYPKKQCKCGCEQVMTCCLDDRKTGRARLAVLAPLGLEIPVSCVYVDVIFWEAVEKGKAVEVNRSTRLPLIEIWKEIMIWEGRQVFLRFCLDRAVQRS